MKALWEGIKEDLEWDTLNHWQRIVWLMIVAAMFPIAKISRVFADTV